jgi:hypothetical protein
MTTALGDSRSIMQTFGERCDAYLTKPIRRAKLLGSLRRFRLVLYAYGKRSQGGNPARMTMTQGYPRPGRYPERKGTMSCWPKAPEHAEPARSGETN